MNPSKESAMKLSAPAARSNHTARLTLLILTAILLVVAAIRILRLLPAGIIDDEVWSVWQTLGTPQQIINWTPYDWPPLFYLIMGAWKGFVGIHPLADRYLSALLFLIGVAAMYSVTRRLTHNNNAGLLAVIAYAGLGYSIHISVTQRGYVVLLTLMPVVLWLMVRYFDHPSWRRALWLAGCLGVMYYIHFPSIFGFVILGIFSLIVYPKRVWRWWLPGVAAAGLIVPALIQRLSLAGSYAQATQVIAQKLPPFAQALTNLFGDLTGYTAIGWAVLMGIATIFVLYRSRPYRLILALSFWILTPVLLYVAQPIIGWFLTGRFLWWLLLGLAMWIGWGLSLIPAPLRRPGMSVGAAMMIVAMFMPVPTLINDNPPPMIDNFTFLQQHIQPYDVILINPKFTTVAPMEWDYFSKAYFPEGIQFVTTPAGYRRVWYVTDEGYDQNVAALGAKNRFPRESVGPARLHFQLYEAPPDAEGILFENGLRFHGLDFVGTVMPGMVTYHLNETFRVRLWWSLDRPLDHDYSIGLYVLLVRAGAGQSAMQSDTPVYANQLQPGQ